jgi:hypothetical protein
MIINMDMRTLLPKVREAFNNKQLQIFQSNYSGKCSYSGPCAVGVGMTEEQRKFCDDRQWPSVNSLIVDKVIAIPDRQYDDFRKLQNAHDNCARYSGSEMIEEEISIFGDLLERLEKKYGTR